MLPRLPMFTFMHARWGRSGWLAALWFAACGAQAQPALSQPQLQATASAVAELRFADLFARPVGPRGLQASDKLLALNGRPVRMVGYMAAAELPTPGCLVLTPLPSSMGDEDEHLADDLPPQAVFVHLSGTAAEQLLPNHAGLLRLQGLLQVGPLEEADGHVSTVRLVLDAEQSARLLAPAPAPL